MKVILSLTLLLAPISAHARSSDGWGWVIISLPLTIVIMAIIHALFKPKEGMAFIFFISLIIAVFLVQGFAGWLGNIFNVSPDTIGWGLLAILIFAAVLPGLINDKSK